MARPHRIWYRSARKAWYVEIGDEQVKLLKGPNDADTRKLAEQEFYKLMAERAVQPPLEIGPSRLTVAALIDGYLEMARAELSDRTWIERRRMLEKFAQFLTDRQVLLVKDCLPLHLLQFIQAHPTWKSDDTKADVVKTIKVAFNWGHEAKIAPPNPFTGKLLRGYTFRNSRRPMTEEEFRKLIGACGEKHNSSGPSSSSATRRGLVPVRPARPAGRTWTSTRLRSRSTSTRPPRPRRSRSLASST